MRIKGFDEIQEEIAKHPSKLIHDEWSNLNRTFTGIYQANRRVLVEHLEKPSRNDELSVELMQNVRLPVIRDNYTNEVLRHLYNYLSGLAALVDHSMKLTSGYSEEELGDFIVKRKILTDSDINSFMGKLRNYVLHYGIPPLGWTISLKQKGFNECTYFLNSANLLRWDGWSKEAEHFIHANEQIDLLKATKEHGQMIDEAFIALLKLFPKLHSKDVEEVNRLIHKRNNILSGKIKIEEVEN